MIKIITGGSGNIAQYYIKKNSDKVILLSRTRCDNNFIKTDYSYKNLVRIFSKIITDNFDEDICIIHAASALPYSNDIEYMKSIKITKNLVEAACFCGIENLIFISSMSIYAPNNGPIYETSEICKIIDQEGIINCNNYPANKIVSENILTKYNDVMNIKILRVSTVIFDEGVGQPNLLTELVKNAKLNKKIYVDKNQLNNFKSFVFIDDVIDAIDTCINIDTSFTCNITTNPETIESIVNQIVEVFGCDIEYKTFNSTTSINMNGDLSKKILDFNPKYNVYNIIKHLEQSEV